MSGDTTRSRLFRTGTRGTSTRGTGTWSATRSGATRTRGLDTTQRRRIAQRRRWRRARERLVGAGRAAGQAVTPLGWFVIAFTALSLVLGVTVQWIEAWFVAVVGAVLLVVALPFLIGSRAYRVGIELDRRSVVAGGETEVRLQIENRAARHCPP